MHAQTEAHIRTKHSFSEFLPEHYIHERHEKYLAVEAPRAVLQVEQVVAQAAEHLVERIGIAVVEGGVGGDARTDLVQVAVAGVGFHNPVDEELAFGAGTDKRHVAAKDVPQLRKLVQVVGAEKPADFRHAGVFAAGIEGGTVLLGIQLHAAELIDVERAAEPADALLLEYGGTAVFAPHGNVAYQKQRGKNNKRTKCQQAVGYALYITLESVHSIGNEMVVFGNWFHKIIIVLV